MKKLLLTLAILSGVGGFGISAYAATAVPWNIANLTDTFISPNIVNGNAKGFLVNASSTVNSTLSVSSLTSGNCVQAGLGGLLTTTLLPCGSGSGSTGNVATSSSETSTYIPFWTSTGATPATLSGGSSLFRWLNPGFLALATSTIGDGTQVGGLTVNGGATTTGNARVNGTLTNIGTVSLFNAHFTVDNNGASLTSGSITAPNGSVGSPAFKFTGSVNSGFYQAATDQIAITINNIEKIRFNSTGIGVGTSTPWGVLSASSSSATAPAIVGRQTGTGPVAVFLGGNTGFNLTAPTRSTVEIQATTTDSNSHPFTIWNSAGANIFETDGSGSTTSSNGFNITSGCYAVNSVCLSSGGGTSFGYPFTTLTNFGLTVSATSTPIWGQAGLFASSTSRFDRLALNRAIFAATSSPAFEVGGLTFDSSNDSLTFFNSDSNVSLQVGQEEWTRVINNTGSTIANGSAVYINGTSGTLPTIALSDATDPGKIVTLGLTTEAILNGGTGFVTTIGVVHGLNTSGFTAGANVYVSTTPGTLTTTAPTSPNYRYRVGVVTVSDATVGAINVTPTTAAVGNGTPGQFLGINTLSRQAFLGFSYPLISTGTGVSIAFGTTTSNVWAGTQTFTNSPTFSFLGAGTVNSTAAGTIYNTATSTPTVTAPITYSGTLGSFIGGVSGAFGCVVATGSVSGCLASTDFTNFNNKISSSSLSVTTTGTSGAATYTPSTGVFNIPQYQAGGNYITALTGDGTATGPGSVAFTLATVNSNVGTFNNVTVNAKGLVTAASNVAYDTSAWPFTPTSYGVSTSTTLGLLNGFLSTASSTINANFFLPQLATPAGTFLALNPLGQVIATTTPGGSTVTGTLGQIPYFNGTNTQIGTSSLFMAPNGFVGVGTTTPYAKFSISGAAANFTNTLFAIASSTGNTIFNVLANGSVGLGTTSPSAFFSIDDMNTATAVASTSVYRTPGTYTWTPPAGVTSVTIQAWGAGGAGGGLSTGSSNRSGGGGGAFVGSTTVSVTPGVGITLIVGQGGQGGSGAGGAGGTGYMNGGSGAFASTVAGGGGGGSTAFGTSVIACGGGGGSNSGAVNNAASGTSGGAGQGGSGAGGGGGCGTTGGNASGATPGTGGTGGTTSTGTGGQGVFEGGGSSAGVTGNGNNGSGQNGGNGSGGAAGGSASPTAGANGTGADSGGGGGAPTNGAGGAGGTPGAGGGGQNGTAGAGGAGGAGEVIINFTTISLTTSETPKFSIYAFFTNGIKYAVEIIDQFGHLLTSGPAPTFTSCGTSPSFVGPANDRNMTFNVGSGIVTSCTINFANPYPVNSTVVCPVSEISGATTIQAFASTTPTSVVITGGTITSDRFTMHCEAAQ